MTKKENCEFAPFMTIIDAKATVNCYRKEDHENNNNNNNNVGDRSSGQQAEAEQKDGCYVTLNFTAHKFDPKNPNYHPAQFEKFFRDQQQANKNNDTLDSLRYGIELKALGHSTIRYKGFENKGYSACCSMLKRSDGEDICEWTEQSKQQNNENEGEENTNSSDGVVDKIHFHRVKSQTSCPLNDPAYDQQILDGRKVYGKVIEGEITRPLHRKVYGRWEARIEFYKDDVTNGIGRIIVPFEMKAEDDDQFVAESLSSSSSSTSKSKEMAPENTNNVAVVSVGKKSNEEEK